MSAYKPGSLAKLKKNHDEKKYSKVRKGLPYMGIARRATAGNPVTTEEIEAAIKKFFEKEQKESVVRKSLDYHTIPRRKPTDQPVTYDRDIDVSAVVEKRRFDVIDRAVEHERALIEKEENMSNDRYQDPFNPFSENYNGEPVGPDSFGGSDEGSHFLSHLVKTKLEKLEPFENVLTEDFKKASDDLELERNRAHGWIQLHSGKKFYPMAPTEEDITIRDIAHSLSHMCRFTGHCKSFYSVAQHCVLVSYLVDSDFALCGLLHDASEAYLVDVPKPLKRLPVFAGYRELEGKLQTMIFEKFGWCGGEVPEVKKVDTQMLATEARDLMSPLHPEWIQPCAPLPITITPLGPNEAKMLFLDRFKELILRQSTGEERYRSFIEE